MTREPIRRLGKGYCTGLWMERKASELWMNTDTLPVYCCYDNTLITRSEAYAGSDITAAVVQTTLRAAEM